MQPNDERRIDQPFSRIVDHLQFDSVITFEFFEDHTTVLRDAASGKEERGTWEQTGWGSYRYTLGAFIELPEGAFREAAEKLEALPGL